MNKAEKWNFEKQEYEEYELPDNCPLICYDMKRIINCADCKKEFKYGECYCSKAIQTRHGFGYPVCEECYKKEIEDGRKYEEYV